MVQDCCSGILREGEAPDKKCDRNSHLVTEPQRVFCFLIPGCAVPRSGTGMMSRLAAWSWVAVAVRAEDREEAEEKRSQLVIGGTRPQGQDG